MNDRYQYGDDHGYPTEPPADWLSHPGARLVRLIEGSVNVEFPFRYIRQGMTFEMDGKQYKAACDVIEGAVCKVRVL